jgi:tetratricopeptide (TPR) repeat protein
MFCKRCGSELREGANFCKACGEALERSGPSQEPIQGPEQEAVSAAPIAPTGQQGDMGDVPSAAPPPPGYGPQTPSAPQPPGRAGEGYAPMYSPIAASPPRRAWLKPLIIGLSILLVAGLVIGGVFIYLSVSEPSRKLSQARSLYNQGNYTKSIEICDEIIKKWPNKSQADEARALKPEAYILYGEGLAEEGSIESYAEAETVFNDLLTQNYSDTERLKKDRFNLYISWAKAYKSDGSLTEAVAEYDNAAQIQSLSADDLNSESECLYNLGEQSKATGSYEDAAGFYWRCLNENSQGPLAGNGKMNWIDMTVSAQTNAPPPGKNPSAPGAADIIIANQTNENLRYYLSGPTSEYYDVPAGQKLTAHVLRGSYSEVVNFSSDNTWMWPAANVDYSGSNSSIYYTQTITAR